MRVAPIPEPDNEQFTVQTLSKLKETFGINIPLEVANRFQIWGYAQGQALEHWGLGVGLAQLRHQPGASDTIPGINKIINNYDMQFTFTLTHPHLSLLELWAEGGIVPLILFLAWLGAVGWQLSKVNRQNINIFIGRIGLFIFSMVAIFSSFSFWSFYFWMPVAFIALMVNHPKPIIEK